MLSEIFKKKEGEVESEQREKGKAGLWEEGKEED